MPLFHWQALTTAGEPRQGAVVGESEVQVVEQLRREQLRVTMVRRASPVVELPLVPAPRAAEVAVLRELLALRGVGLGAPAALGRLASGREAEPLAAELTLVRRAVEAGQPLAEALARVPQRFDELVCRTLAAGEARGELDHALRRLVDHLEQARRPTAITTGLRELAGATAGAVLTGGLILGVLAPAAAGLYARLGVELTPLAAGLLVRTVALLPLLRGLAIAAALAILALVWAMHSPRLRPRLDALALRSPGLGPALRLHGAVRLGRLLALLLAPGVPLLTALELAAPRLGNHALGVALLRARTHVATGVDLETALADAELLPPLAIGLLRGAGASQRAEALALLTGLCEAEADERAARVRRVARALRLATLVTLVLAVTLLLAPLRT